MRLIIMQFAHIVCRLTCQVQVFSSTVPSLPVQLSSQWRN